jgi:hypothetical protein
MGEEQDGLADVHGGVQQHEEGAEDQGGLLKGDAGDEVGLVHHGTDQAEADTVGDERGEEQKSDQAPVDPAVSRAGTVSGDGATAAYWPGSGGSLVVSVTGLLLTGVRTGVGRR